jgi:hypothetical protein
MGRKRKEGSKERKKRKEARKEGRRNTKEIRLCDKKKRLGRVSETRTRAET